MYDFLNLFFKFTVYYSTRLFIKKFSLFLGLVEGLVQNESIKNCCEIFGMCVNRYLVEFTILLILFANLLLVIVCIYGTKKFGFGGIMQINIPSLKADAKTSSKYLQEV